VRALGRSYASARALRRAPSNVAAVIVLRDRESDTDLLESDTDLPESDTDLPESDTDLLVADTTLPVADTDPAVADTNPPVADKSSRIHFNNTNVTKKASRPMAYDTVNPSNDTNNAPKEPPTAPNGTPATPNGAPNATAPATDWVAAAWALSGPVETLRFPFATLSGEAIDVARFCQRNWDPTFGKNQQTIRPGLKSAVGNGTFTDGIANEIIEITTALQAAQSRYRLLVDGPGSAPMERAQFVLGELRSTLEWLFDDGKLDEADAQLEALSAEHDSAVSQDAVAAALFDYAELASRHRAQLAGLGGFDVTLIDEAPALGTQIRELSAGPATEVAPPEDLQALELRNRLGMLLYDRMQRVRSAARFVFRHYPDVVRKVTSTYARRQRSALRGKKTDQPSPATDAPSDAPEVPATASAAQAVHIG
jgi:hypothetical protein